jgi:hypothetical protein
MANRWPLLGAWEKERRKKNGQATIFGMMSRRSKVMINYTFVLCLVHFLPHHLLTFYTSFTHFFSSSAPLHDGLGEKGAFSVDVMKA